jgi:Adenylate cyclase, family 3 (some proteins contain HAMP domain)
MLISFLLVLVIACGSIIFGNYYRMSRAFLKEFEHDIKIATETIESSTIDYLMPAKITTQFLAWSASKKTNVLDQPSELVNHAIKMLDLYPQIAGFYNGDRQGNLLAIKRVDENAIYPYTPDKPLPSTAKYEVRIINRSTAVPTEFHYFNDHTGRTVAVQERPNPQEFFDPRLRPWYRGAEETKLSYWSDPYVFLLSQQVGVTAATPAAVENQNINIVISADITMVQLSQVLANHKIGHSGITFMLNKQGEVIGYPELKNVVKKVNGKASLATYLDTQNPVLIKAYKRYLRDGAMSFEEIIDDVTYIVRFKEFGKQFNKKWLIGFIAPKSDFTAEADHMVDIMMTFSFVIVLLAAALIFMISKNIAKPIEKVAKDLEAIGKFQIDNLVPLPSRFYEIHLMNDALEAMKRSLKDFSRFVPKAVVTKLIESGSGAKIGGKKLHVSLMFTDIKGFSSISEQMSSEKMIKHLSDYLNELTKIIQEYSGTIDKYIGDAIMTFWGAPLSDPDHAVHACAAAIACRDRLVDLNRTWQLDGKPPLYTRFGIHTGDAIIGNVGSEDRLNYSAFGDSVNIASRLEGVNKHYGTTITISHATYKAVRHKFICRPLDKVAVVGKSVAVRIYELLAPISTDVEQKLDQEEMHAFAALFEEAFDLYQEREWDKAQAAYNAILKKYPHDQVAKLFAERLTVLKATSPGSDWDGVYRLESK